MTTDGAAFIAPATAPVPGVARAIVTGASSGVGAATAAALAASGTKVVNLDLRPRQAGAGSCDRVVDVPCDLGAVESIREAFAAADRAFDGAAPDLLVCSAAMSRGGAFLDVPVEDVDALLAVNVRGLFVACQEAGRRMRTAGRGAIVVVTSIAAYQGWRSEPAYCATKGAQAALVSAMAVELAPFGIAVNAVAPGPLDAQTVSMVSTRADPEVLRHDLERIPQARFGTPEEIAAAIVFFASARWVTGQTLAVDGGFLSCGLGWFGAARDALVTR